MLKLKLQYFGHLMRRDDSLEKTLMLGKIEGKRRKGWQRMDEMVRQHHRLKGHEYEQTSGDNEEQGSLACCSPWGHKGLDTTQGLNKKHQCINKRKTNECYSSSVFTFGVCLLQRSLSRVPPFFSVIFFQAPDIQSTSFDAGAFLILPKGIKGRFSDNNQDSYFLCKQCLNGFVFIFVLLVFFFFTKMSMDFS